MVIGMKSNYICSLSISLAFLFKQLEAVVEAHKRFLEDGLFLLDLPK